MNGLLSFDGWLSEYDTAGKPKLSHHRARSNAQPA